MPSLQQQQQRMQHFLQQLAVVQSSVGLDVSTNAPGVCWLGHRCVWRAGALAGVSRLGISMCRHGGLFGMLL